MATETVSSEQICPVCHVIHNIQLPNGITKIQFENDMKIWKVTHGHVQKIFRYLNADEREMLISGMCNKAWDEVFGDEE